MFASQRQLHSIGILTAMSFLASPAWSNDVFRASIQLPATETTQNIEEITLHVFDAETAVLPITSRVFLSSELVSIPTTVGDKIFLQAELEKTKEMDAARTLWIEPEVNGITIGQRQIQSVVTPNMTVDGWITSNTGFGFPDSSVQTTAFTGELDPTVISSVKDGVTWTEIASRPAGLDDGDQVGITTEADPTVTASVKDGVTWAELSGIPLGFSDNIDNVGITTEVDPQVSDAQTLNRIPRWNGSSLVSGAIVDNGSNIGIGTSAPDPDHKLHVNGLSRFDLPTGNVYITSPGGWPGLIVFTQDGSRSDVVFNNDGIYLAKSTTSSAPTSDSGLIIRENGRVGIGTAVPGERLTVMGTIESKEGGIKFPDGTVQSSASAPTWHNTIQCDLSACPRFELVMGDAAVLDKETGLVWQRSPLPDTMYWDVAINECTILSIGNRKGWHLATVEQLASLIDASNTHPALPSGHLFTNIPVSTESFGVYSPFFWTSTTRPGVTQQAFAIDMVLGDIYPTFFDWTEKRARHYAWCVRGGQSNDPNATWEY